VTRSGRRAKPRRIPGRGGAGVVGWTARSPSEEKAMMNRLMFRGVVWALALVFVTACGGRTKEDILQKARDVSTRADLEKALGQPTDIAKLGPMERWTYKASNGEVVFLIIGDTVTLQTTGGRQDKPK